MQPRCVDDLSLSERQQKNIDSVHRLKADHFRGTVSSARFFFRHAHAKSDDSVHRIADITQIRRADRLLHA
jgi:hypothetical protein